MSDLDDLFKIVSEGKKKSPKAQMVAEVKQNARKDLDDIFEQLSSIKEDLVTINDNIIVEQKQEDMIVEDMLAEVSPIPAEPVIRTPEQRIKDTNDDVNKYLTGKTFQQPNPEPVDRNLEAVQAKLKFLEQAIGKIAATGPGGGEVNLRWLDDVDRSTIVDGRWLKYNAATKKFVFDDINPYQVVYNTTHVTTSTYTVQDEDFYIGVDYAGPCTITLPSTANSGRLITIKDEDGDAATNPITVIGTVDNDAGGFIIQINNGAIQMIYRNGWRII